MNTKKLIGAGLGALLLVTQPVLALTDRDAKNEQNSDTWLEAKLDTTIALNRYLSLRDIDTDVRNQTAYLTGTVKTNVEKELAAEISKSIDGIKNVDNKIVVDQAKAEKSSKSASNERSFGQVVSDLSTTANMLPTLDLSEANKNEPTKY